MRERLAQKRQQVEIEEARLRAVADKAESDAERLLKLAKSKADERSGRRCPAILQARTR